MGENKHEPLSEGEIALMDALKTVIEIIMTAGIAKPEVFDRMFTHQHDSYLSKRMGKAAGVMEHLRRFATDSEREAYRETLRRVLQEPPRGSA